MTGSSDNRGKNCSRVLFIGETGLAEPWTIIYYRHNSATAFLEKKVNQVSLVFRHNFLRGKFKVWGYPPQSPTAGKAKGARLRKPRLHSNFCFRSDSRCDLFDDGSLQFKREKLVGSCRLVLFPFRMPKYTKRVVGKWMKTSTVFPSLTRS